jgi:hypothetical protein
MLHACLCTISFVFCYTSWCFYAFSGTNLLTRCHSARSLFSAILCFRKVIQEIFSELDETKVEVTIFPTRDGAKAETEGGHAMPWRRPPPGRARLWDGPLVHPLTSPFHLYILLDEKTVRARTLFQKTYCKPAPSSTRDREGPEALPGTLPERGITIGDLLHHHAYLRSDV